MGFLIRVLDDSGEIVEQVIADLKFNPMRAGFDRQTFPLLGALDPYRDTTFEGARCEALEAELQRAGPQLAELGVSADFIAELTRLCRVSRAAARRVMFIGD